MSGYEDPLGAWHPAPQSTVLAILEALGAGTEQPPPTGPRLVRAGTRTAVPGARLITTENGDQLPVDGALPADLPLGYHTLEHRDGFAEQLIVTPGRCRLPDRRRWGWAVQLYALRSRESWGIGDLGDGADFGRWAAARGAGMQLLSPLHAVSPGHPQQPSPYSPSSRRFRNPLLIAVERVSSPAASDPRVAQLGRRARELNSSRLIDRDRVWTLKRQALELLWTGGEAPLCDHLDPFAAPRPTALRSWAVFCAIADEHGDDFRSWPEPLRRPHAAEVEAYAACHPARVRFHGWLQGVLDQQLEAVGGELPTMQDLAIGVDPGGADAWCWQDILASGFSIGAPPDDFNTRGQDWGLPPFDPWRLRRAGYRPFVETLRAGFRHAAGLRLDHVMGLFRLFWIPRGAPPDEGVYVRYPAADLLDLLALESVRAGAYVVGEDLGTVAPGVRDHLAARNILSYRLLWFEQDHPRTWPERALAAVNTHDLPTIAGLWTGSDLAAQQRLGLQPHAELGVAIRERVARATGLAEESAPAVVIESVAALLAEAPTTLLTLSLDDALAVEERPNMPGTVDIWPNWSLALPLPLEEITETPLANRLSAVMSRAVAPGREVCR